MGHLTARQQRVILKAVYLLSVAGQRRDNECKKCLCRRHTSEETRCAEHYFRMAAQLNRLLTEDKDAQATQTENDKGIIRPHTSLLPGEERVESSSVG